jgi:hypothetical protein
MKSVGREKLDQARSKHLELAGTYDRVFVSPDGQAILKDLEFRFNGTTLKKHEGLIDPNASIAASGCREVLLYISQMRKYNVLD